MAILIVDDEPEIGLGLKANLETAGYHDVVGVGSPAQALEVLGTGEAPGPVEIDVILLDLAMPQMDGIETCRWIKAQPRFRDIPIIMMAAAEEEQALQPALAAGAMDFIRKPVQITELLVRVRSALTWRNELERRKARESELTDLTRRLQESNQALQRLSTLDGLTGIANRRHFDAVLNQEWWRGMRQAAPLSVVMGDIDYFKAYNDCYGHPDGDACLRQVARALKGVLKRHADLAARYGGEEFAIILPETGAEGTAAVAESVRAKVESLRIPHPCSPTGRQVTISLGTATMIPVRYMSPLTLITAADRALYQAKHDGRNRVKVFKEIEEASGLEPWVALNRD